MNCACCIISLTSAIPVKGPSLTPDAFSVGPLLLTQTVCAGIFRDDDGSKRNLSTPMISSKLRTIRLTSSSLDRHGQVKASDLFSIGTLLRMQPWLKSTAATSAPGPGKVGPSRFSSSTSPSAGQYAIGSPGSSFPG